MAMVNMNNLLNGKDSRWLQLEVCREFQRNKCTRSDTECKFAHPPVNIEVQSGRVIACYDSIKDRCNRETPPCKYFHPPQHLKDQLLINGRNHLALKNALKQQMGLTPPGQPILPGQVLAVQPTNPYLAGVPQVGSTFSPYFTPGPVIPAILGPDPASVSSPLNVVPQSVVTQQKITRSDRLEAVSMATVGGVEVGKKRVRDTSDELVVMDMKSVAPFYYESFAFPGMIPYKRPAADKSGMPVYQPNATTYQQLMQLQPPPFVPVPSIAMVPPPNAHHVVYTDEHGQLLDTLPVCQDFMRQFCNRPACKFIHLQEAYVEVVNMRVTVCRDAVKGKCTRPLCKYYHIPIPLPPASEMAAQLEDPGQTSTNLSPATVATDAVGQLRTNMMVSSGNPNRTLCHQIFGFNS